MLMIVKIRPMKTRLLFALPITFLTCCGILWEHRSLESFDDMEWNRSDTAAFSFSIDHAGPRDISILVRHVQGFPFAEMGILAITGGPSIADTQLIVIPVIGSDRKYLGEGSGDLFDLEYVLHEAASLEAGDYNIRLVHQMSRDPLPLIMEVGIQVNETQ